ncbi:CLUMA_CG020756, isoform A [Clunio marinus]|uniref:CLUMA_CG020756, isoform A n=1 Tax=Clunio marinus TaxID=568069 RepID=A0A1J1J742_9DIPT|nr:CLUMA_CG020756, isoform A [Clunio marinus]
MTYHGASKYDRFMTQQSPYVESKYHSFDNPTFQSSSPYINVIPPSMNYHHNQSYLREVPSPADNSIKTSNYQTTGVGDIQQKFPYPNMLQVRHDDFTQASGYQQISAERKPFDHDGKDISNEYLNSQTINPIYSQQPFTMFDEKSSTKALHPIYQQQNNQPLQSCNYSQESLKLSKPFYDTPLILPAASSALLVTQLSPKSTRGMLSAPSDEILLKSHPENMQNSTTNVHMSDGDEETESDGEKRNAGKRNIRRNDLIASGMMHHQQQGDEGKVNIGSHQKLSDINTGIKINEFQNLDDVNETIGNENMHQIWEKIIEASPVDAQNSSNFVIPKIIVETQIDLTTAAPKMLLKQTMNEHQGDFYEKQDGDTPEKLLNHSKDDQQNESLSLQPQQESKVNNNSPLEQTGLTIYHNDKQPFSDEQQKYRSENRHHQQHPTSSVEHELRDFDRIQITDKEDAATRIMTYESEIKTNNSMAEGSSDDIVGSEEGTKAINNGNEASAVSLNDKINEIYRKIEKIEGDYYDGKGKIIEISERRMSSSSLNDSARIETLSINDSPDIRNDEAKVNSPQNIQQLETFHENIQRPVSIENNIYETDENEWPEASNGNEIKSQETSKADYNYENFVADENQQNFIPSQAYDDALTTENDYTSTLQAYQNQGEFGQVQQFENQYDASDVQTNNAIYDNAQYSYDSTQQNYENYVDPQQNQQQQQQESEYVYSHHDNTQ